MGDAPAGHTIWSLGHKSCGLESVGSPQLIQEMD